MVSITVSIPEDIKKKMENFPEVNWSGLVKKIIIEKVERLMWKEEMLKMLEGEKEFTDWAVELIRKGRNNKK
ncbi:MAG: hypothetical protein AABX23_02875 [Nanoarchaeota archaeon]